jgi:hypothetical protein
MISMLQVLGCLLAPKKVKFILCFQPEGVLGHDGLILQN